MNTESDAALAHEPRRGAPGSLRAQVILDAALRLFAEKGFDGTTISEIEKDAGLAAGRGGFYRHFASKEAVFRAVAEREIERVSEEHAQRLRGGLPPTVSARDRILVGVRAALASLERREALLALLERDPDRLGDLREHVRQKMLAGWVDLQRTELGMGAGASDPALGQDSEALAVVAISAVTGFQLMRRFFGATITGVGPDRFALALASLMGAAPRAPRPGESTARGTLSIA